MCWGCCCCRVGLGYHMFMVGVRRGAAVEVKGGMPKILVDD